MKKIASNDPETRSADIVAENLEHLKALFPEAFTEGKIDFKVLKQLLGSEVEEREEKYGLNWHGKRQARQLALTPSTGTLRPFPEESVEWDTTQNLMIEGDNLEVLKLLQKSYAGKVKLIYIDPPYNTGKDFVYPDDYRNNIRNYLKLTGQIDGDNQKLSSNTEASGRFHTDWMNMMYPRLKLARQLLRADGLICVSIDDEEVANLRLMFDEIFGPENRVEEVVWKSKQQCWVHKTANVLDKLPKSQQPDAKQMIHDMYLSPTKKEALAAYQRFWTSTKPSTPRRVNACARMRRCSSLSTLPCTALGAPAHDQPHRINLRYGSSSNPSDEGLRLTRSHP